MPPVDWTPSPLSVLTPTDPAFPDVLRHLPKPPSQLFVRGAQLADELRVAVVGTRHMTAYGQRATELIVKELVHHDITIVSGLAIGIDAAAHDICMNAGGKTIAVLPGGIDDASIAPRCHRDLGRRILETGGTLVSERPPGSFIEGYHFLLRNRIIAALANTTIVVEADHDSGALVTAKHALDANREVLAVPGSIWSDASRGTNDLIKQGARPCTNADDIFAALGLNDPKVAKQIHDARAIIPLSPEETTILDALTEPRTADDIARATKQPITQINAMISMLELKGRIISVGPRMYAKAP